ncbi:hypothetical protein B425_0323 [Bacillus amyloliquefaciens]|nr:hypothetical protein B425_0323 [Bacillus amyloliquefaciens]
MARFLKLLVHEYRTQDVICPDQLIDAFFKKLKLKASMNPKL